MVEGTGLYRDGRSAREAECKVVLDQKKIILYFNKSEETFLIWDVSAMQSAQLLGDHLTLHYGKYPHQELVITGTLAHLVYAETSDKHLLNKLDGITNRKSLVVLATLIAVFAGAALLAWFVLLPWVAEKAAGYVDQETEKSLGDNLAMAYSSEESRTDSATTLLKAFAAQLNFENAQTIEPEVLRDNAVNAFALPGGRIFVYSGIIERMESYEELVALLGHEASHVIQRHSLKSICRSAAGSLVIAAVFGDVTGISSGILSQADQLKQLDYSRTLETEADLEGLKIMQNNRVNGRGMLSLLKMLKKEGSAMPGMMQYLSTHPDTDSRISAVEAQLSQQSTYSKHPELERIFIALQREIEQSNN